MSYAPLHVHSDASPDGAGTVASLVAEAVRIGCTSLALTDHGTLANAVAFWSACTDAGIKPILGMEAYLAYEGSRHHVTILSMDEGGFNNLVSLDTDAHVNNWDGGYPLVTMDSLYRFRGGLVALSGCVSSALYKGEMEDAAQYAGKLTEALGSSNVFLEMMFLGSQDTWTRPWGVANRLHLPYVITNDTHYPCQHQFPAHQCITEARRGFTYDSKHLWLKSREEIENEGHLVCGASIVEAGLDNSLCIADRAQTWNMKAPPTLPHTPEAEDRLVEYIRASLIREVTLKKGKTLRLERVRYELRILKEKGFLDYIYILWDIVSWAKANEIRVGPGRGSGGGSYLLYLLGVTEVDPLEYDLMFERFINPSRADYPDVDVDFESDRRQEVMNYASEKWGTVPIATYSAYGHKSAVHDIARVLHIPKDLEIPASEAGVDSEVFEEFIGSHTDAAITYQTMLGQIRHRGKHAAGVIIANRPVPIERAGDELVAAWAEGMNTKDLSKVGIVKFDLLGLTALSQLKRMEKLTGSYFSERWNTYNDPVVYEEIFCRGDVSGVFQWSGSEGIRDLTVRIAPRNFYDLTTCNALYRPGALDAGTAEHYPEFMKEPRLLHPRIDPLLSKTYGVICYQEQVMAIVAEVMGGDLAQADIVRRLISKAAVGDAKWEKEVTELRANFVAQGTLNGFPSALVNQLWHEIYTHSGYSYNLAHATTYTMISYQMAWYKAYRRPAFTTAVLQYDKANAQTYIIDAIEHGLAIEMPNVEYSTNDYELKGDSIYLPLSDIAFLGEKAIEFILADREANGPYGTYEEFAKRVPKKLCNNRTKGMMERIGAFKDLKGLAEAAIDKYADLPLKGVYETQLEILGYVIPTESLVKKMEVLRNRKVLKKGYLRYAGFISGVKQKESSHGKYSVFTLSPQGSFWMRDPYEWLKVGVFVAGSKSTFGHSNDVKRYNLDSGE